MSFSTTAIDTHGRDWNAVYTRHQHEKSVAESLIATGLEVFLPTYTSVRKWSDRKKYLSLPLFPCYVFVQARFERRLQLLRTPGIQFLVTFAGEPAIVPGREIEAIRKALASGFRVEPHPFLRSGDWVRVKSGSLADVEGIFVRRKGSDRLVLSCELLGKSISVELDAFNVARISRPSVTSAVPVVRAPQTERMVG